MIVNCIRRGDLFRRGTFVVIFFLCEGTPCHMRYGEHAPTLPSTTHTPMPHDGDDTSMEKDFLIMLRERSNNKLGYRA